MPCRAGLPVPDEQGHAAGSPASGSPVKKSLRVIIYNSRNAKGMSNSLSINLFMQGRNAAT